MKQKLNLIFAALLGALGTGALIWVLSQPDRTVLVLGCLTAGISVWVFLRRNRRYGMLDPLAIFCATFAAYNGLILIRVGMQPDVTKTDFPYPTSFGSESYLQCGALCLVAASTIAVVSFLLESKRFKLNVPVHQRVGGSSGAYFIAGSVTYAIGCVLLYSQIQLTGGWSQLLQTSRADIYQPSSAPVLSLPFAPFILAGLAFSAYATFEGIGRFRTYLFYGFLTIWIAVKIATGDRRPILTALICVAAIATSFRPGIFRLTWRRAAICVVAYLVFVFFGQVRWLVPKLLTGTTNAAEAMVAASGTTDMNQFQPERTEFAGPFFSLLESTRERSDPLYGSSYLDSLAVFLPRFLYGGDKPLSHSREFDEWVRGQYMRGLKTTPGWGYSPVAEAYDNARTLGVVIVFAAWTLFFIFIAAFRHHGPVGIVLFSVLIPEAVNANRIDFRVVYTESLYLLGAVLFTWFISKSLNSVRRRTNALVLSRSWQ